MSELGITKAIWGFFTRHCPIREAGNESYHNYSYAQIESTCDVQIHLSLPGLETKERKETDMAPECSWMFINNVKYLI